MAFELKDFFRQYVKRGDQLGVFNIAREDPTSGQEFYAYQNECGAYLIQKVTTSGTLTIHAYYARKNSGGFGDDWTNRASLTYGEYYALFNQTD